MAKYHKGEVKRDIGNYGMEKKAKHFGGAGSPRKSHDVMCNDESKFANLPQEYMLKDAGVGYAGQSNEIGDEYAQIERQLSGDEHKYSKDYKLRKA